MSVIPELSLGVPVYNGMSNGLVPLIAALLSDPYQNFELLISDNGSTDGSRETIEQFAKDDDRVRANYFEKNQGVQVNYNAVLGRATGTFFKWCAVGDLVDPGYLDATVGHMRTHPETSLAHCLYDFNDGTSRINQGSHWRRRFDNRIIGGTEGRVAGRRVHANLRYFGYGGHFYAVVRREVLARLGGHDDHAGSDHVVTSELLAMGPAHWEQRVLWSCYAPAQEIDYREYGLRDGEDFPALELEILRRGHWRSLDLPSQASVVAALVGRYGVAALRGRAGRVFASARRAPKRGG